MTVNMWLIVENIVLAACAAGCFLLLDGGWKAIGLVFFLFMNTRLAGKS